MGNALVSIHALITAIFVVDCNSLLFGCRSCGFSNVTFENQTVSGLQCTDCDFGLYLLKLSNTTSIDNTSSVLNMCLPRCEDYSYQYVSNPNTRQCEYCGPFCTKCTLQKGCTDCYMENRGYFLTPNNYTTTFPYNTKVQPSKNFQTCQNCSVQSGVNSRCDSCNKYNQTYCESCYGYVTGLNSTQEAALGGCNLCTNSTYSNCMQCNLTNTAQCLTCNNGFFLNSTNKSCTKCTQEGCQRCGSNTNCQECTNDYVLNSTSKSCLACQVKPNLPYLYELQDYRCTQCNGTTAAQKSTCAYCDLGFMNSTMNTSMGNSSCQLKCGISQYPIVNFQSVVNGNENLIKNTTCFNCPKECYKCIGNDTSLCTECYVGQYLSITNPVKMTGQCLNKTTETIQPFFDIYVSNLDADYLRSPSLRNGDLATPFVDLQDALVRGKELAAKYTQTVKLNIYLTSGIHYLLRDRGDSAEIYYPTQYFDPYNLNYEVYINPVGCPPGIACNASMVTIFNKRRESFTLDVAVKLHIRHVIINSIDSVLPSSTDCLGQRRACCSFSQTLGIVNSLTTDTTFSCATAFTNLKLDLQCQVNMPRTLFRMRLNNQSQITQPNELILENSEIRNIFYDMNSLVNFTEYGGKVKFYNTKFTRITICGSIIKNYYTGYPLADYSNLDSTSGFNALSLSFLTKMRRIQQHYYNQYYDEVLRSPLQNPFTNCDINLCFDIDIRGSTFSQIPFGMSSQTSLNVVSNDGGLRYQASIINTKNFQGHINIQDSNFTENKFNYDGCENILNTLVETPTSPGLTNNFKLLQIPSANFNVYQLESLISIMNHNYKAFFYNNTFLNNIAFKGIINLELIRSTSNYYPIVFYQNNFTKNAGIIDSNVLNLRIVNNLNLLGSSYLSKSDLGCGGVEINTNNFQDNYGCFQTNGAIMLYCYNSNQSFTSSSLKYSNSYDSQYFIGQSGNSSLTAGDKSQIIVDQFSHQYQLYIYSNSTTPIITLTTNLQWVVFKNNRFYNNFAGANKQITDIQGFPIVYIQNDVYVQNQNYISNSFRAQSLIFQQQTDKTLPVSLGNITQNQLNSNTIKAQAILTLTRSMWLNLRNVTFDNNYVSDSNTNELIQKRSSAIMLTDFYGYIYINESTTFKNNTGIRGINFFQNQLASDIQAGFKTSLIAYNRCQFATFILNNVNFLNNLASYDKTFASSPLPYLFFIQQELLTTSYTFQFEGIKVQNNTFYNTYGMMYFDIQNLAIKNSFFLQNNKLYDDSNNGLLVIKLNDTYTVDLQNNQFSNIYTNNMSILYFENQAKKTNTGGFTFKLNLYNNIFDDIISSKKGSAVIYIEGNTVQQNWTSNYLMGLNFTLNTFKNLQSEKDQGIITIGDSNIQSTYYQETFDFVDLTISNITIGHFLKIGTRIIKSSQDFKQNVNLNRVSFTGSQNGNMMDFGTTTANSFLIDHQLSIQNSQFLNFTNGSIAFYQPQILASQNYMKQNFIISSNTFTNILNGSALWINEGNQISASSDLSITLAVTNLILTNIGRIPIMIGSHSLQSLTNINIDMSLILSAFDSVQNRMFSLTSLQANLNGNYSQKFTVDSLQMKSIQRSPIYLGALNVVASGFYNSQILIQNTQFDNVNNQLGAIANLERNVQSNSYLISNFTVINCRFSNYTTGNAIYFQTQTLKSVASTLQELYLVQNSNFSDFIAGSSILMFAKNIQSYMVYTFNLTLQNVKFINFSNQSAIQLIDSTIITNQTANRYISFDTLVFSNIQSSAIQMGKRTITSDGQITSYNAINNCQFTTIKVDGIQFGDQAMTSKQNITSIYNITKNQFTSVLGNALSYTNTTITSQGSYQILRILNESVFTDIGNNAFYISGGGSITNVGAVQRSFYVNHTTFTRIGYSALNITSFSASSTESLINTTIEVSNTNITSTGISAFHHGLRNLNSAAEIISNFLLRNLLITNTTANSIFFDLMTASASRTISLNLTMVDSKISNIGGYGMYMGGYNLNTLADTSISLNCHRSTIQNVTLSGLQIGDITQIGGNNFQLTSDIQSNTFTQIQQDSIKLGTLNAQTIKGTSLLLLNVVVNTFSTVSQNAINIGSRLINSQSRINLTAQISRNTFTNIGLNGIIYSAQNFQSLFQTFQNESYLSNSFTGIGSEAISLQSRTITSKTIYTHILNISLSSFTLITKNAINIGTQTVSSQNSHFRTIDFLTNSFDAITQNAINIQQFDISNMQGTINQQIQYKEVTFKNVAQSAVQIGKQTFESGASIVIVNTTHQGNTFQNISINGIQKDALFIRTTNTSNVYYNYNICSFTNISNSSITHSHLNLSASSIDNQYLFNQLTHTNLISGIAIDLGSFNLSTITTGGFLNQNLTVTQNQFTNIAGAIYGYGIYMGNMTSLSRGQLNETKLFTNNQFTNVNLKGMHLNVTNLTSLNDLNQNFTVLSSTYTNIILDSGISIQNQTLKSTSGNIRRNVTLISNTFTNIGKSSYQFLNLLIPDTFSSIYNFQKFESNSNTNTGDTGFIISSGDYLNLNGTYYFNFTMSSCNFANSQYRGIYFNTIRIKALGQVFQNLQIKNSNFTNARLSAISTQNSTIQAVGDIIENYNYQNIRATNMMESRGIYFGTRDFQSSGQINSSFTFDQLQFTDIQLSQGIDILNQTILAQKAIKFSYTFSNSLFSNILQGSGIKMTKNTLKSNDSIDILMNFVNSTFSNINSENEGSSFYVNHDSCSALKYYKLDIEIDTMTFKNIQKGGAIKFRDFNSYSKEDYIFIINIQKTTIDTVSSGVGLVIIKDSIKTDGIYNNQINILGNTKFNNIQTLNGDSAILLQEAYILSKGYFSTVINVNSGTFTNINKGPAFSLMMDRIETSQNYLNVLNIANSVFQNLTAAGNSSISIQHSNSQSKFEYEQTLSFTNILFDRIFTGSSVKMYISNLTTLSEDFVLKSNFVNCQFTNLQTNELAAIIAIDDDIQADSKDINTLSFTNTTFIKNIGNLFTSSVFVDSNEAKQVTFDSSTFTKNNGLVTNEIYFRTIKSLSINNCIWSSETNNQNDAQFLYKDIYDYSLLVQNSQFSCGINLTETSIFEFNEGLQKMASLFVFSAAQDNPFLDPTNQFYKNSYTKCNQVYKGAIFRLSNGSQIYDEESSFISNSALFGGVAYAENSNSLVVISTPVTISKNVAFYGGFIYLLQQANATISQATFSQSRASEGAVIYMIDRTHLNMENFVIKTSVAFRRGCLVTLSGSWFELTSGTVELNTAYYESAFIHMSDARDIVTYQSQKIEFQNRFKSLLRYVRIQKNEVLYGGKLISLNSGDLEVHDCQFYKNYIYQDTEGIFAAAANIWINNTIFEEDQKASYYTTLYNKQVGDVNGAYLNIGRNSTIYINTTQFIKGRGNYGGCVSIQGTSKLFVFNATFISCSAYLGGGIYAVNVDSVYVASSKFYNNIGFRGYSVNIYAQNIKLNMTLIGNSFQSYHNSVFLRDGIFLYLEGNTFTYEANRAQELQLIEYGGGLHIVNTIIITLTGTNIFQNLRGLNGGAIFITTDINFKNLLGNVYYSFDGVQVTNCTALADGGALYLRNIKQMDIKNSTFNSNSATKGNGGAIQFLCYESWNDKCSLTITSTQIQQNTAQIGGGIRWNWVSPIIDSQSQIINNIGTLYGQDFASFARELVLINSEEDYQKYFNKSSRDKIRVTRTLTSYTYTNVQSGGYIPTQYLALIDDQGQVVTTNSGSMIQFDVQKATVGQFETQVSGVNKFFSAYGVYNVSGLLIVAAPSSKQSLQLTSIDAVDLNRPSNQIYLKPAYNATKNISSYVIQVGINIRGCIKGEGLRENGACYQCPKGTYLLQAPIVPEECKVCPAEKAICQGGSNIGPQPGYWRKNNETDNFIECFEKTSCLGMLPPANNPVGDCLEGYYGAMCTACMPGYSRSGDYACSKCPDPFINILRISGIMVIVIIVVSYLVKSTINSATKKNTHSVYSKILMNHLQLLSICAAFKFEWPEQVTSFFSSGSVVQSSQESIVSFDCQMDTRDPASILRYRFTNDPGEIRVLYQKTFIFAGLPVIICSVVVGVWSIILKRKKQMNQLETRFVASVVIIFFLVHPTITQNMINIFNCQSFDSELRLMKDLQVICNEDFHVIMAYAVAAPCIALWGIGIPASVWFLMTKDKEKLDTLAVKQKFGFLYNGYKRTNYFWEIVIMYRKIGLIGVAVFMNRIGVMVQALVLLIILVGFLQINNMRRPFATRALNDIEDLSLLTGIITIYCAIFFISSKDKNSESFNPNTDFNLDETSKLILFGVIVLGNLAFILTWFFKFIAVIRLLVKERYSKIYVIVFLCCRQDKLEKENEELAKITKRETIIEKVEEIQFFLKNMKKMYTRQIFYEGHQQFLKMLYFIENEKSLIDMTEKKHNFYIQGKMARDRKFDPIRMAEVLDQRVLSIDDDIFGNSSGKQNLTQLVSEFDADPTQKQIGKIRRQEFHKKATIVKGLKGLGNTKRGSIDESISPKSSYSQMNTAERMVTGMTKSMIYRDAKSSNAYKFYQNDLDETGKLNNSMLDETQLLNESSRGLLQVQPHKFQNPRKQNYIYNASSGSFKGFISGSGIIDDGSNNNAPNIQFQPQQSNSASDLVLNTDEKVKALKKKKIQPLEDRLQRSRNANAKLNKQKKHRVQVDDIDEENMEPRIDLLEDNFAKDGLEENYRPEMNLLTDMNISQMDNIYFSRGKQGQFDTDFLYEDESVREKRLMRGLTKRLAAANTKGVLNKAKPKSPRKSPRKNQRDSMKSLSELSQKQNDDAQLQQRLSSQGGIKQLNKNELKIDFLPQPDSHYRKKNLIQKQTILGSSNNIEGEALSLTKTQSQIEKVFTVDEILRQTRLGKKWRENLNYSKKLREKDQTVREIMFDNFTQQVQVRDYNHEVAEKQILKNVIANDLKSIFKKSQGILSGSEDGDQSSKSKDFTEKSQGQTPISNKNSRSALSNKNTPKSNKNAQGGNLANNLASSFSDLMTKQTKNIVMSNQGIDFNKQKDEDKQDISQKKKRRGTVRGQIIMMQDEGVEEDKKNRELLEQLKQRMDDNQLVITLDSEDHQ